MQTKHITLMIAALVIVAAGSFYGGTAYEKSSLTSQGLLRNGNNGRNMAGSGGFNGQVNNSGGNNQRRTGGPNGNMGGFISGEVLSKDDKSLTIKNRDGGSTIVYFDNSSSVGKTVDGSLSDLATGEQVMINGKTNSDGSITAQNIQIRPNQPLNQPAQ